MNRPTPSEHSWGVLSECFRLLIEALSYFSMQLEFKRIVVTHDQVRKLQCVHVCVTLTANFNVMFIHSLMFMLIIHGCVCPVPCACV